MKPTKKFILRVLVITLLVVILSACKANNPIFAQNISPSDSVTYMESAPDPGDVAPDGGNFLLENWAALLLGLMAFAEVVTRLTPTEKDNTILAKLQGLLNVFLPNLKKGGGKL